jgi:hypothetical protein
MLGSSLMCGGGRKLDWRGDAEVELGRLGELKPTMQVDAEFADLQGLQVSFQNK